MPFPVKEFLNLADLGEKFKFFQKSNLLQIAAHFNLNTNSAMKKADIKSIVAKILIDKQLLDSHNLDVKADQINLHLQLEIKKLEKLKVKK